MKQKEDNQTLHKNYWNLFSLYKKPLTLSQVSVPGYLFVFMPKLQRTTTIY